MKPLGDRILIQPITEEVSAGGIILPEKMDEVPVARGLVVNVGNGTYSNHGIHIAPEVKIGDKVLYMKFSGEDVGNGNYLLRESDILAVI